MRKQSRPAPPPAFSAHCERWTKQWMELKSTNPSAKFQWYSVEGTSARELALEALRNMNQKHCSFCDAFPIDDRGNEPIEHFRPKSHFPEEAYAWGNLYYCCEYCQTNKGNKWDESLIRPDTAEYNFVEFFSFDFTTGAVEPNRLATAEKQHCAEVTIRIFGLDSTDRRKNRKLEARKYRPNAKEESEAEQIHVDLYAYRDYIEMAI